MISFKDYLIKMARLGQLAQFDAIWLRAAVETLERDKVIAVSRDKMGKCVAVKVL